MKRILIAVAVVAMASTAMGAVGIEFGSNWFKPRLNPANSGYDFFGQGQNMTLSWTIDNGMALGVYSEATMLNDGYGNSYPFNVNAIMLSKGIVKNVDVGIHVGSFYEDYYSVSGLVADIYGAVTVVSGKGEKVEGALKGIAGGRFADNSNAGGEDWGGWYINLVVALLI
jgi:hypothetical protein